MKKNILPSERRTSATDVIVKYVREGRNYGLSFEHRGDPTANRH